MHRGYLINGYGNMFWMWIVPLVLLVLIAIAVYMILKNNKTDDQISQGRSSHSSSRGLEILDVRYAKGEIDEEEYKKMKRNLNEK